jgi:glycosyltransferase involved in cell wall biosynthesis
MNKQHVCIAFLGNILYDTRALNLYKSLSSHNYFTEVISFDWENGADKPDNKNLKVFRLDKKKSSLFFYVKFSIILFLNLLSSKAGAFFAEDIYTLPFVCIAAKMKGAKVFYDSRELFGFLAGLKDKKRIQKILAWIEKRFIAKTDYVIVTGEMDGEFLKKQYNINNIIVLRNLPFYKEKFNKVDLREKYSIEENKKILLYQGVVLHGRGLKVIFDFLKSNEGFTLLVIGYGAYKDYYEKLSHEMGIAENVIFAGKIPQEELLNYSAGADMGLALIENISLSYYYALPNKLFEYIMTGLPVAVSKLPQMEKIVNDYNAGICVDLEKPDELSEKIKSVFADEKVLTGYKTNCLNAAKELNWDKEIERLFNVLN